MSDSFQDLQKRYVRSVKRLLDSHGTPTFLCDPVPGEDVHEVAAEGLAAARLMVAFCSETYGGSSSRDLNFREIGSGITKIPQKMEQIND